MKTEMAPSAIYGVPYIATLTHRSNRQVYRWVKSGALRGHYRRRGGAALELIFTADDVNRFLDLYLSPYELESDPQLERLISSMRKRAAKAREAATAKRHSRLR